MKQIILTRGMVTQVDDEDFEWLNQWNWYAAKQGKKFYVSRRNGKYGRLIHMHRLILGLPDDPKIFADHKDRDGLNNQRDNLRIADRSQNNSNRICIGSSGYLGVFRSSAKQESWFARIRKRGKITYLGCYVRKEDAALAYNKAAIEIHGEFANLNVIESATNIHSATG